VPGNVPVMISRDVIRNSGPNGCRAVSADRLAVARTARPRTVKLPTIQRCGRWSRTS